MAPKPTQVITLHAHNVLLPTNTVELPSSVNEVRKKQQYFLQNVKLKQSGFCIHGTVLFTLITLKKTYIKTNLQ